MEDVLCTQTTYPHSHGHKCAGEDGHDEERVGNRQVGEPQQSSGLHRRDGQGRHAVHEAEHADAERNLQQRNEVPPQRVAGRLVHHADLGAGLGAAEVVARDHPALHLVRRRLVARVLEQLLIALRILGRVQRGLEQGQPDADGHDGNRGPPGQAGVDVDGLEQGLHERGRAPAVIEPQRLEEADLLGDVEKVAARQAHRGGGDVGQKRGIGGGGGSSSGTVRDGGLRRGIARLSEREGILGKRRDGQGTASSPGY